MVVETGPTRRIAEFIAQTRLVDVPARAIEGAKLSILDTLACGLAALDQPVAIALLDYIREQGGREVATVLGAGGYKTSAPQAALANGCLVNILDLDGFLHAPTHTLPAAIAAGELAGATGAEVLEAYILAFEVANRLQEVIEARRGEQTGPTYRGWYHVSLYGPLAASLAAGRVLKRDIEGLEGAIGAAACGAGGVRENLGARAKSLSSGVAASLGVQAALLARRGMTGAPNILEARVGLINAVCLPGEYDWEPVAAKLGSPYRLACDSLGTKRYPAIGATQSMLGSLARIRETAGIGPEDVESVEAHVSTFAASGSAPKDELEAGFSWPYMLAMTLLDGSFGVQHLQTAVIAESRVRAMMDRVRFMPLVEDANERIIVHTRDGRDLVATPEARLGRVGREQIVTKYRDLAARRLSDVQLRRLEEQVMTLEGLASIADLTATLAG
jgi:2-methylcitrate dehydratase PrpD